MKLNLDLDKIINQIFNYNPNKKKKFFVIKNLSSYKKIILGKIFLKKSDLLIINIKKISINNFLRIFIMFFKKRKIKKNFLIIYNFEREIKANNLIPDFKNFNANSFLERIFLWLKDFSAIFFKNKSINYIIFEIK